MKAQAEPAANRHHKKLWRKCLGFALVGALAWGVYEAAQARSQLVTLKLRDAEVRQAVHQIERQTWRSILVHREVRGLVTLDVKNMPLPEVLDLVARQVHCRSLLLYPLYSSRGSLARFKQAACGQLEPANSGWSNLVQVVYPATPPMPRGRGVKVEEPISLHLTNRQLRVAALAFSRFANLQVVPEDGCSSSINLSMQAVPPPQAVQMLAGHVQRHTAGWWSLLPGIGPGPGGNASPPPGFARPPTPLDRPPPLLSGPIPGGSPPVPPPSLALQEQMEQDYQELMAVLPNAQAAQLEAERQLQGAMQRLPPDQQQQLLQQQFESESSSLLDSRRRGLRQSSVAERVERDRAEASQ